MALRPILRWPDDRLATPCAPVVPGEDVAGLIADMFETMYDAPGRGLAAPQVGVMQRLFVIDVTWKDGNRSPLVMVNPRIVARSEDILPGEEGCLSIPGILVSVDRPARVEMDWTDEHGVRHRRWLDGAEARCAQHELDHLDGIVTLDRLQPEARADAIRAYRALPA